jgi:hypothetical protein
MFISEHWGFSYLECGENRRFGFVFWRRSHGKKKKTKAAILAALQIASAP